MMPKMDGYKATAVIRRRQNSGKLPHFPIIALTANAAEGDREKCLVASMGDYLAKPFRAETLIRLIKSWGKASSLILPEPKNATSPSQVTADTPGKDHPGSNTLVQRNMTRYFSDTETALESIVETPGKTSKLAVSEGRDFSNETTLDTIFGLSSNDNTDMLNHLIDLYFRNPENLIATLNQAWTIGDLATIRSAAYSLKCSNNQVGAFGLADLCRKVEYEARSFWHNESGQSLRNIKKIICPRKNSIAYVS